VNAVRRGIGVLGELMITTGLLLLLFVTWQLWWTDVTANREQAGTILALEREFAQATSPQDARDPIVTFKDMPPGKAFAILRIPRLGADFARPLLEGTGHETLMSGLGHYPRTAMPGQIGNFALAGHRTTYGRPFHDIDTLRSGDVIVVETKESYDIYLVQRHVIVLPTQVDVVAAVPQEPGRAPTARWLTMTACHPKFSAEYRYVVFAKLERAIPRAQGLPPSYVAAPKAVA